MEGVLQHHLGPRGSRPRTRARPRCQRAPRRAGLDAGGSRRLRQARPASRGAGGTPPQGGGAVRILRCSGPAWSRGRAGLTSAGPFGPGWRGAMNGESRLQTPAPSAPRAAPPRAAAAPRPAQPGPSLGDPPSQGPQARGWGPLPHSAHCPQLPSPPHSPPWPPHGPGPRPGLTSAAATTAPPPQRGLHKMAATVAARPQPEPTPLVASSLARGAC